MSQLSGYLLYFLKENISLLLYAISTSFNILTSLHIFTRFAFDVIPLLHALHTVPTHRDNGPSPKDIPEYTRESPGNKTK
jgi:hypothetical protein